MKTAIVLVITTVFAVAPLYGEDSTQPPPTPAQEHPAVLTRGPVHEAFAEPVDLNTQPGVMAPTQPPANIVENPPSDKPVGDQYVWVPGYWAWDSERNDYIWVSGCWRAAPPGRYWMPGYWSKTDQGWTWVPGFWAQVSDVQQIEYLPAPPAIADVEPPGAPPTDDNIWVPPCWYWYQGQYIWRNGYWLAAQEGWLWTPSHYVCTPRGYVFVAGNWDYPLRSRGVLFAPVYIPRHVWERPGFSLSLGVAVDIGALQLNLFTCPRYSHFYFGDYYDDFYIGIGIFPQFECESRHSWYDPIYEHDRWSHRADLRWEEHERHDYELRRTDKDMRPPRTYREMEQQMGKLPKAKQKDIRMARTMDKIVADKKSPMKFETINTDARQKISTGATELHKFGEERSKWESSPASKKSGGPNIERSSPATQPTGKKTGLAANNKAGNVSVQETKRSPSSERVNIPSPPIVGKQEGFFSKTSPSQPADEHKTDVKHTPKSNDAPRDKDTSRDSDSSKDKGSQRDNRR